mgnify:CR=1 FL=1
MMSEQRPVRNYWAFDDSLGYLARLIFRSFSRLRERHTREYGISSGQWTFLRQLWREDGISQRELSRRLAMRDATTAVTLRTLARAALLPPDATRRDRREILLHLTSHARFLEKLLMPATAEIQTLATRNLSDAEVDTLRRLLLHVIDNLACADPELQDSRRTIPHPRRMDRGACHLATPMTWCDTESGAIAKGAEMLSHGRIPEPAVAARRIRPRGNPEAHALKEGARAGMEIPHGRFRSTVSNQAAP